MTCDSDRRSQSQDAQRLGPKDAKAARSASPESCADAKVELVAEAKRQVQEARDMLNSAIEKLVDCHVAALEQSDAVMGEAMLEVASEAVYDFLDARFPGGAMPGGQQLFADDHLDTEFKHEAGCTELAKAVLKAALQGQQWEGPAYEYGVTWGPIAPVQDDDAEWLRNYAESVLDGSVMGVREAERLKAIASRLSRQAGG